MKNIITERFQNKNFNVLITGGAGFIGGCLVNTLLKESKFNIFNLDKLSYSSDHTLIDNTLKKYNKQVENRYHLFEADLLDFQKINEIIQYANPDLIFHLAAESHVDRSIDSPKNFVENNIQGTLNLLESVRKHFEKLNKERKNQFRFINISTDEVFGSLGSKGFFNESTRYDPTSPYSASKASSDHLVNAWFHTYGIPTITTNCSNNFGPWQFPEKLIPLTIIKALSHNPIPIYGNGKNIRDWLYVEDHINALIKVSLIGEIGQTYCIGGYKEKTNLEIVESICLKLDVISPSNYSYKKLIKFVADRPGHDFRYAIDSKKISEQLSWKVNSSFSESLDKTINWYVNNQKWCWEVLKKGKYSGERIGRINNDNKF